jgi:serine/threonine protein kinase
MTDERYENKTYIGSGGMSTVYRAWDSVVGRDVALKEVAEELRDDEDVRRLFLGEARKMAKVIHPHVVQVYDVLLPDDVPTIIQEFMEGGSLSNSVGASTMTSDEMLNMLADVFSGLDAIHQAGLVHRDMKPDNILLSKGKWKVADFGVAMSGEEEVLPFIGNKYAAPEVLNAPESISPRSDIYSMGIIAMELLLGSEAFEAAAREALLLRQGSSNSGRDSAAAFWQRWVSSDAALPLLCDINPVISREVSEFIARLAARDAEQRPASCAEVLEEIALLRDGETLRMGAPTAPDPRMRAKRSPAESGRKKKTPLWFKIVVSVLLLLLTGVLALLLLPKTPKIIDVTVITEPPGAEVRVNEISASGRTPLVVSMQAGDMIELRRERYLPQNMTLVKGLEGLARNADDVLVLSRTLERSYTLDNSEAAQEFFADRWRNVADMGASIPTALEPNSPYRLPLDTALYVALRPPQDGALTMIHLSSDDMATLVYPSQDNESLGVYGQRMVTVGDELDLHASEPLGREWILLVLTPEPLIPPDIAGAGRVEDWARYYSFEGENSPAEQLLRWLAEDLEDPPLAAAVVPIEIVRMQRRDP